MIISSLCALASDKKALAADLWDSSREDRGWTPCFV